MAEPLRNRRIRPKSLKINDLSASPPENKFLSPPLSILSMMSPPPRPQADDYLGSKRAKKRRQSRPRRPCPTPLFQSEDTGSGEASSGQSAEPRRSKSRNVESSYDSIDDAGFLTATAWFNPSPPLATIAAADQGGKGLRVEQRSYGSTALYRPKFIHGTPNNQDDPYDSPAVNSLRRISRSMTQPSDSKRSEFKHLSRTLTDKIGTMFRSKGKISFRDVNENTDRNDVFGFRKASTDSNTLDKYDSGDLSPTSKVSNAQAGGLRIPASITLRKASGANPLSATTNANNPSSLDKNIITENQPLATLTATSNLVSFQSQRKHHATKSAWQEEPHIARRSTSPASSSSYHENPHIRARFMSITRLGTSAQSQQYTIPAEPALTVTSFYPTRAVPLKPQSRSNSVSPERVPFRFSIVQMISRNSIHEVIWYEDETSNSGASSSPISPTNASQASGGSVPQGVLDSGRQETPLVSITTASAEVGALPQVHDQLPTDPLIDPTDAHKRLLSWSWDNPQPSIADFPSPSSQSTEAEELRYRTSNVSMRRAATADILAPGYFPHHTGRGFTPTEGDSSEQSMAKTRNEAKKERDKQEAFDRGLDMFQRRGISLGSVRSARIRSLSIGEKNGVKGSGSQLRMNTK